MWQWRGSALAFPFGEGGPLAVEEVLPQYEFAERFQIIGTACCTSPAPCGGTLPKGEGLTQKDRCFGSGLLNPVIRPGAFLQT